MQNQYAIYITVAGYQIGFSIHQPILIIFCTQQSHISRYSVQILFLV